MSNLVIRFLPLLVFTTKHCPENKTAWSNASKRLNCTNDSKDIKGRYHCVPDEYRSTLLEFCYDRGRILVQEGNCLEFPDSRTLNNVKCSGIFSKGCPGKPYYSDEMYNNLDCLSINDASKCFTSDPLCPVPTSASSGITKTTTIRYFNSSSTTSTDSTNETEDGYPVSGYVAWILVVIIVLAIIVAVVIYKLKQKILQRCPCLQLPNNEEDADARDKMMPGQHITEEQQADIQSNVAQTNSLDESTVCLDAGDEYPADEPVVFDEPNSEDSMTETTPSSTPCKDEPSKNKDQIMPFTPENQNLKSPAIREDTLPFAPYDNEPRNNEDQIMIFTGENQMIRSSIGGTIFSEHLNTSLDNKILMIMSPRRNGNHSFSSIGTPLPLVRMYSATDIYKPEGDLKEQKRMVAAIDFGTSYSGYSYSLYHDFKNNPNNIQTKHWNVNLGNKASLKTPTTLLLNSNLEVVAFGYEAEEQYMDLAENNTHFDYYLFEKFKMMLKEKEKELSANTFLLDKTGKKLKAMIIVAKAIKHLKSALFHDCKQHKDLRMSIHNIHWVLTVPTMWGKIQNEFMCEAAKMAGIPRQNLILTDEATAVAYFCKYLPLERMQGSSNVSYLKPGTKYMVLDAGGGTVDITVHEIKYDFNLKKLGKVGGPFGGTRVDQSFTAILEEILGKDFFLHFSKKHTADYLDFLQQFEYRKRRVEDSSSKRIVLRPRMTFCDEYERKYGTSIGEAVKTSQYNESLVWNGDKLTIENTLFAELFKTSFEGIVSMVKNLLAKPRVEGTNIIIMVGGFSESPYLQRKIRTEFQSPLYHVLIPDEPGLAILKGAVIYGHQDSNYHLRQMCGGYNSS